MALRYGRRISSCQREGAGSKRAESRSKRRCAAIFNVENVLGAVAAGLLLDIDEESIQSGVARASQVPGRFEAIDAGQPFAALVDYAHTPGLPRDRTSRRARTLVRGA